MCKNNAGFLPNANKKDRRLTWRTDFKMSARLSRYGLFVGRSDRTRTCAELPAATANTPVNAPCAPAEPNCEPTPKKIRKSGTGCVYQINDNLWEGSFYPHLPNGKRKKFNVYAPTRDECETKLAEMIERVKAEIAEEKAKQSEGALIGALAL